PKKEFRWSNGKMPKSFDPALASAPPETDVVRAVYEGLTDTNPKTLKTISAVAIDWASTDDNKIWTFKLRRDADWSNGEKITANDFVRSWLRLKEMGEKVAHYKLLGNIVGMQSAEKKTATLKDAENLDLFPKNTLNQDFPQVFQKQNTNSNTAQKQTGKSNVSSKQPETEKKDNTEEKTVIEPKIAEKKEIENEPKFGVEAIDDYTLRVSLVEPDKDFPALAANPILRPIYGDGKEFDGDKLNADIVTNGAFRIFSIGQDGLTLDRAENYWNKSEIELERVRFVPTENAEKALEAYRAGDVDVVTNANFEPLALKILTPFSDFERTTYSALNFYEFNQLNIPFQDRRVREALAISIERERLTEDDMDGASRPAFGFLPFDEDAKLKITQDNEKGKNLLTEAGFPNGENFPTVRLLINRNNVQQRIARSVAKMWKENLNIETEITIKESSELDALKNSGDFDLIRRGVVLPTTDETANMLAILSSNEKLIDINSEYEKSSVKDNTKIENSKNDDNPLSQVNNGVSVKDKTVNNKNLMSEIPENFEGNPILTESEALYEFPAIPLYFPTSYSLVKPYILGFETNNLDAPSLKNVRIDNNWQPKKPNNES
ncbi:MAG: peptide ABC transporter substrate-binding protein, partial [Acidobacteriota bacterium]